MRKLYKQGKDGYLIPMPPETRDFITELYKTMLNEHWRMGLLEDHKKDWIRDLEYLELWHLIRDYFPEEYETLTKT